SYQKSKYFNFTFQDYISELYIIAKELSKRQLVKKGEAPSKFILTKHGYRSFYESFAYKDFVYSDVVKSTDLLKKFLMLSSWKDLTIDNYAYELKRIIDSELKEKLGLREDEAPTRTQLEEHGYARFAWSLKFKDFTYLDVIKRANLKKNQQKMHNRAGNAKDYAKILLSAFTPSIKKKIGLGKFEAPSRSQLKKIGLDAIYSASIKRDFKYSKVKSEYIKLVKEEIKSDNTDKLNDYPELVQIYENESNKKKIEERSKVFSLRININEKQKDIDKKIETVEEENAENESDNNIQLLLDKLQNLKSKRRKKEQQISIIR
ncbi:MAG TPA: hypothetical protein VGB37_15730, partial [Candidatus Lokiarchaeia archaeon]